MDAHDLVVGVLSGTMAVVFGIVPGLLSALTLGVRNFEEQWRFGVSARPRGLTEAELRARPLGLAVFGACLITFTVVAYILAS